MEYLPYMLNDVICNCNQDYIKTNYFIQCLQNIQILHKHDILHRDIKPDNFMVTTKGQIRLLIWDYHVCIMKKTRNCKIQ